MRIAIEATLLIAAAAMGTLVRINIRDFRRNRRRLSRNAAIVSAGIALWCIYAAGWFILHETDERTPAFASPSP